MLDRFSDGREHGYRDSLGKDNFYLIAEITGGRRRERSVSRVRLEKSYLD